MEDVLFVALPEVEAVAEAPPTADGIAGAGVTLRITPLAPLNDEGLPSDPADTSLAGPVSEANDIFSSSNSTGPEMGRSRS